MCDCDKISSRICIMPLADIYFGVFSFLFQPVLHNWCNKGYGMYYPIAHNNNNNIILILFNEGDRFSSRPSPIQWNYLKRKYKYTWHYTSLINACIQRTILTEQNKNSTILKSLIGQIPVRCAYFPTPYIHAAINLTIQPSKRS